MNKRIISQLMLNGKNSISEKILLKSIKSMQKVLIKNHRKLIKIALVNLTSLVKVKQLKQKRSQSKEFPFIVNKRIRIPMVLKSMFKSFDNKTEARIEKQLVNELLQASKNIGSNINKRKNTYEYSFIKKKYSHYRWF
jgi:ribosomal protein S7